MKSDSQFKPSTENNPLLVKSSLQYQAPEFDKIKDSDFKPAMDYALQENANEIESIANNPEPPTFENTVVALETSGETLKRVQSYFFNLTSSNTNEVLQQLDLDYAPIFAAHRDKMFLNDKLYQRIKTVANSKEANSLQGEDKRLLEFYVQNFEMSGANLSPDKKSRLKEINESLASLSTEFSNKLLGARKKGALLIHNEAELKGLPKDDIEAAKNAAIKNEQKGYRLDITNTTQQTQLQVLDDRYVRQQLFAHSWERAEKGDENDTRDILKEIAILRLEKAQLMGKENFSDWRLQNQMSKGAKSAQELLYKLSTPAVSKAKKEASDIQNLIDAQGGGFQLEASDWNYYAEQIRKQKFDIDEEEIKPYFEVTTVLEKGVFYAAEKLYGITFKVRKDLPVYHPDVVAYEVFDSDGSSLAIYYLDFYTRDNKNGGAWMSNFVEQSHYLKQKPVIVNVFNFQKPVDGKPSLISWDNVTTMFHEFGHSIHGIFANQKYESLSGTNVPRDFVEFPSQINEKWALDDEVLRNYAIHYQTGQPISSELVEKIKKSSQFNQGYAMTELVAAATLDLMWHSIKDKNEIGDVLEFEKQALLKNSLMLKQVPPRYHSPYFLHIWSNGYASLYYAYLWSEVLDYDAYDWFKNNGGMTRANGDRFRKEILSVGNSIDLNEAFRNFTGKDPNIDALLKGRGLK